MYAAIDPPPGAGDSLAVSFANSCNDKLTSLSCFSSFSKYSMIFFSGINSESSSRPSDFTAI